MKFFGRVKDGKLEIFKRAEFIEDCKQYEGRHVTIEVSKKTKRSLAQNNLYWLYVDIIRKELGYDKDTMHEIIKFQFLKEIDANEKTGEIFGYIGSTANMDKVDFMAFISELQIWAAEMSIYLPDPEEQMRMFDE